MSHYNEFGYLIVNDDFEIALAQLKSIIHGQASELALTTQKPELARLLMNLLPDPPL
jgi:guanylate kinase